MPLREYTAVLGDYLEPVAPDGPVSDLDAARVEREDDPTLRLFLRTLFERSVVTSTQVELQFAGLTMLTTGGMSGPKFNLPALSAKACGKSFADAVSRWRALPWIAEDVACRADGRSRPAWTKTSNPGHKTTYLHLFAKQVKQDLVAAGDVSCPDVATLASEAKQRFALLPPADKASWKAKAAAKRVIAAVRPAPIDLLECPDQIGLRPDGPLHLSSRDGLFPVRPDVIAEKIEAQTFAERAKVWASQHSSRALADSGFPDSVPGKAICSGWCKSGMDADKVGAVEELVAYLRRILRFFGAQNKADGHDPTTVLKFRSANHTLYYLVAHTQQQSTSLFEAELLLLEPALAHLGDPNCLPILLGLCPGRAVCGARWPEVQDEHEAAAALIERALDWEISIVTSRPAVLGQRYATVATVITTSAAKEKEDSHFRAARAMRAFKQMTGAGPAGPKQARRASCKRKAATKLPASGPDRVAAASSSSGFIAASGQLEAEDSASASDSPSSALSSDEDLRDCWHTVLKALHKEKSKDKYKAALEPQELADAADTEGLGVGGADAADTEGLGVGGAAPFPVPAPAPIVAPPLARGPRVAQAKRGARIVEECGAWRGLATISEVTAHGRVIGYGITCSRHRNAADKPGTQCKKQCLLREGPSAISDHEARQRLKRWYVGGHFQEAAWPAEKVRFEHLKFGGQGLHLLASDADGWSAMSDAELNDACRLVPPPV